jgi:integrase
MTEAGGTGPKTATAKIEGTVFKKCDRVFHRPQSNRGCAAGTCQHTCDSGQTGQCPHAWTLRYMSEGRQRELSFRDQVKADGSTEFGSGKKEADKARIRLTSDKLSGDRVFIDYRDSGKAKFGPLVLAWIASRSVSAESKETYRAAYSTRIRPVFADMTLRDVAAARDRAQQLLTAMADAGVSIQPRRNVRMLLEGTLSEAVKAKKIREHCLDGLQVGRDEGTRKSKSDFVFPSHAQIAAVAAACGIAVWLMRGLGLRIEEALGVHREDFLPTPDGVILRLPLQATRDGKGRVALKHRKRGDHRDIPVPGWLWAMVAGLPGGPLCPGTAGPRRTATPYLRYADIQPVFAAAAAAAGIADGFTFHSLRHAYASAQLGRGVPIRDVSEWLGHQDIRTTDRIYRHLMPDAAARSRAALDAEYAQWQAASAPQDSTRANAA